MTYRDQQLLADIQAAIDAIRSHLNRGDLTDGLVPDAVRIQLPEIGAAAKALPADLLDTQPTPKSSAPSRRTGPRSRRVAAPEQAQRRGTPPCEASPTMSQHHERWPDPAHPDPVRRMTARIS